MTGHDSSGTGHTEPSHATVGSPTRDRQYEGEKRLPDAVPVSSMRPEALLGAAVVAAVVVAGVGLYTGIGAVVDVVALLRR